MSIKKDKHIGSFIVLFVVFWFFGPLFYIDQNRGNNLLVMENGDFNKKISNKNFSSPVSFKETSANSYAVGIDYASLNDPGFIAIIDNNLKIIGASKFLPKGTSRDFQIILTEPLRKGDYYDVKIYQDNGNRRFYLREDIVYLNPENNLAFVSGFLAQ